MKKMRKRRIKQLIDLTIPSSMRQAEIERLLAEAEIDSRMNNFAWNNALRHVRVEAKALADDRAKLYEMTLGQPPERKPKYAADRDYWLTVETRLIKKGVGIDLRVGLWFWRKLSQRYLNRSYKKLYRKPACRKATMASLGRLRLKWREMDNHEASMIFKIRQVMLGEYEVEISQPAIVREDNAISRGWLESSEEGNRKIAQAQIQLDLIRNHVKLLDEEYKSKDFPICKYLDMEEMLMIWQEKIDEAKLVSYDPKKIRNGFLPLTSAMSHDLKMIRKFYNRVLFEEDRLTQMKKLHQLLKSRFRKAKLSIPYGEIETIEELLVDKVSETWLGMNWSMLKKALYEINHNIGIYIQALEGFLKVNELPIDQEIRTILEALNYDTSPSLVEKEERHVPVEDQLRQQGRTFVQASDKNAEEFALSPFTQRNIHGSKQRRGES